MNELPRQVARMPVGQKAAIEVLRKGERKTLQVQLGELDAGIEKARAEPGTEGKPRLGLSVQDLSPEIAQQLGVESGRGVVVTNVVPESPADQAGLRRRDVVLEVNQQAVTDVKSFRAAIGSGEKGALLLVQRGDAEIFVAVKPPE